MHMSHVTECTCPLHKVTGKKKKKREEKTLNRITLHPTSVSTWEIWHSGNSYANLFHQIPVCDSTLPGVTVTVKLTTLKWTPSEERSCAHQHEWSKN